VYFAAGAVCIAGAAVLGTNARKYNIYVNKMMPQQTHNTYFHCKEKKNSWAASGV